ncbi:MAG: type IV-A pilus assembly ATPase PilB [Deltaproteobacteria bacterium]|nr:type IV-A pilus assembly ATPase PilB [Deltaproteobacteria bacterium]
MSEKIGGLLLKKGVITPEQLDAALAFQKEKNVKLGVALTRLNIVKESTLLQTLSEQHGLPAMKLSEFTIDPDVIKIISSEVAAKYMVLPISLKNSTLIVAMNDPSNIFALDDLKFLTGYRIEPFVAADEAIMTSIDHYYNTATSTDSLLSDFDDVGVESVDVSDNFNPNELAQESEDAPIIKLVNAVLSEAVERGASDIHIESYEKSFRIRYRVDGTLSEVMKPPMKMRNAIVSRIKIMAKLDIAERRMPQDGRIKLKMGKNREMDYRVSVLPTLFGEKVVMRLLDKSNLQLDMTKLGFDELQITDFKEAIYKPYGMVLVTGPTGSGKTTTLYSALSELNKVTENISTAEDPVEFNLEGINQVQIHEDIGLNFASALRSFLRQDPDIILVGEIRDFETAEIGIKAALTGHMVLSTLHTNDAPSTINRLLNMGIEPFLVSSAVNCIVAQRLARKICPDCKEARSKLTEDMLAKLGPVPEGFHDTVMYKGRGCDTCKGSGYKGRIALYEVMTMSEPLKELVLQGASSIEIKREAINLGMKTLRQSGIQKMLQGVTTLEEVLRSSVRDD